MFGRKGCFTRRRKGVDPPGHMKKNSKVAGNKGKTTGERVKRRRKDSSPSLKGREVSKKNISDRRCKEACVRARGLPSSKKRRKFEHVDCQEKVKPPNCLSILSESLLSGKRVGGKTS